jgi:hypothetical protein
MRFAGEILNPAEEWRKQYDAIPSFGVNVFQKGLQFAFPEGTKQRFYQDLKNPIKRPATEQYIYNRHVFDEDNPFPIT